MSLRRFSLVILGLTIATPALAQRAPFPLPDPDPEVERASFILADGFEVNLFAADPVLAKPIQMNFDPRGRLWVVSSEVYPQIEPGQKANDKVLVLEDVDGDGKSDTTTIFADGLLIPTGIEPGDGGAYVANSTELLHLKDTDGDGRADTRRVVLSGFGTEDTHHILHTLRWGCDGRLYFNQSIYIHSHIETPHGVRRLGGGGIWQFRPETMRLEVFIRGLCNPWGHHFDRWGQSFATDGAGGEGINYCLPGAYYFTAPDAVRVLPGLNPGSPKDCGLEFVSGRQMPESWQGSVLTNDFRGNRVCRYVLSDDGAGFAAREQAELIKTKHVAFRPIDVKMGPDGAIYIADWYNPIIQHGEVDFRDPRRDHTRGRIWRVTAKGRPLVDRPKLIGAPVASLLDALKAPEDWTRQQAKRVLKEKGAKEVVPALASWVSALDEAESDVEHHRLEALWTYQSLDVVEPKLLESLLKSIDPRVRAAATRVAGDWSDRLAEPVALLADRVNDDHPRVRLEAVRALASEPSARAAVSALRALERPVDRFIDYALRLTARELRTSWLPEVLEGKLETKANPSHLVFALEAVGTTEVVEPLLKLIRSGTIAAGEEQSALDLVARKGQSRDLSAIFEMAVSDDALSAARRASLLGGLVKAAQERKVRPGGDLSRLRGLLGSKDDLVRAAAARAAGSWQVQSLCADLEGIAAADETRDDPRQAAFDALGHLGGTEAALALERLSREGSPRRARPMALAALAAVDPRAAADRTIEFLQDPNNRAETEAVVSRFSNLRYGPSALVASLRGKTISADAAKLAIRAARGSGREEAPFIEALRKAGGLGDAPKAPSAEERIALLAAVTAEGDAKRGESVFRRKDSQCLKCHAIAGAGGLVGPSLESIGASAPVDYLLDSLLEPNKAVKENYHASVVATRDGKVFGGIVVRQTDGELVLRDAEDREVALPLSDIEERKPGASLMPAGLPETLTRGELVDLLRFLSELGKIGPYSVGNARAIRRWQVLEVNKAAYTELRRWGLQTAAADNPSLNWLPAYSDVSGTLPLGDLPVIALDALPGSGDAIGATAFARGMIDVTTPGRVELRIESARGLSLWVDGTPVDARELIALDLATGVHTVTFAVRLADRRDGLRCELRDVPGSAAQARPVPGK